MSQVVIENPIINSPFEEPTRHFRFSDEGITNEKVEGRRTSSYFIPIAKPKKKGSQQLQFDTEWTQDRIEENKLVNDIRGRVALWRKGGYVGVTPTTARLIAYWTDPNREKKLFFCQNEALETAIYIAEVAKKYGDAWIENSIREANDTSNPGLPRMAFKMATGSGKTVVMAMLIAWHTLNKRANPQDARFSDTFLIITPGITIRDRLRVLLPNDPDNYYRQRDIVPAQLQDQLGQAKIVITNYHSFQPREKLVAGKITKSLLTSGESSPFTETPDQMVRRVCRELSTKKNIIVLNDEAHHCYRRKPDGEDEPLTGDDRIEAKQREEEARVWISGIEAVKAKIGVKGVYDLSATPFFLRGSGYPEGTLFPWVVSDFSLIDAIEAGIVKVPRVPVADDSMTGEQPTYRDLWLRIREQLPKKGRKTDKVDGEPKLPLELQGALLSLYGNYEKYYRLWEQNSTARARGITPPVFIVVCNNTNVSKLVFDFIVGWEKQIGGQTVVQAGQLPIFRNDDGDGGWLHRPNTILVDSQQLESGEAMSDDFKKLAAREIDEFKADYRARFPGRDVDALADEDLLREVMNTVGKPGKLGEHVKCVVSVSMLTEGWDANTVTHVLGVRAFGTQLLCEQVVGRALRRMSYATNDKGHFNAEYAEVYGVPFSFIPCSGGTTDPKPGPLPTRVRALESRISCEITFPRLLGYRYDVAAERLTVTFTEESTLSLSTADIPTKTENAPIVGESSIHTLDDLLLAKLTLEKYFRDDDGNDRPWLFPQLLGIAKRWVAECLSLKDNTFPQLLLLIEFAHDASDRIYKAIIASTDDTRH
jgi:type III restriction enzyme